MFNLGSGEIALIAVAALLILGPSRLPELARGIGKFMREFRRQTDEVRGVVEREFYKMDADIAEPQLQVRPAQDTQALGSVQPAGLPHGPLEQLGSATHEGATPPVPADPDALPVPADHLSSQLTAGMPASPAASADPAVPTPISAVTKTEPEPKS